MNVKSKYINIYLHNSVLWICPNEILDVSRTIFASPHVILLDFFLQH